MTTIEWWNLLSKYRYPSDHQIKRIRQLMDEGITDMWEMEERINCPENHSPVIIDFIEFEMRQYDSFKHKNKSRKSS